MIKHFISLLLKLPPPEKRNCLCISCVPKIVLSFFFRAPNGHLFLKDGAIDLDDCFDDGAYDSNNGGNGGAHYTYVRKGELDYELLYGLIACLASGVSLDAKSMPKSTKKKSGENKDEEAGDNCDTEGNDYVIDPEMLQKAEGAILVFMPGVQEISRLITILQNRLGTYVGGKRLKIMALHGNLTPAEQKSVFQIARPEELKIVVSTNVAEASVTIPDVTVVVDTCRVKEVGFDTERRMASLEMKLAAQDSLRQRRGHAA